MITLADLDYELPPDRIAQHPLDKRDSARLLVVDRHRDVLEDRVFSDLPELVGSRDLLVVNDTRVRRARIRGAKPSGGAAEALLLEFRPPNVWRALIKCSGRLRPGLTFRFGSFSAELTELEDGGVASLRFGRDRDGRGSHGAPDEIAALPDAIGEIPIPPYIRGGRASAADLADYQTIFAQEEGSVAAPTASLHFTPELAARLDITRITLEVGPGTFQPLRTERIEDHPLGRERFVVPPETADAIARTRQRGGCVIGVGTTVVRALESTAGKPGTGETDLLISPGYAFSCVDSIMTNFHLPRSSLLALVMAFCGVERTRSAYAHALRHGYRFYSYGDAMWIK